MDSVQPLNYLVIVYFRARYVPQTHNIVNQNESRLPPVHLIKQLRAPCIAAINNQELVSSKLFCAPCISKKILQQAQTEQCIQSHKPHFPSSFSASLQHQMSPQDSVEMQLTCADNREDMYLHPTPIPEFSIRVQSQKQIHWLKLVTEMIISILFHYFYGNCCHHDTHLQFM